ncbi:MAG: nucleotidyltransferase family protein [Candidatus Pelagadaptatus aseana]|uniref:nucleotidyltransferase family protein n=1 Tax=Candidatus Pelagadaptatus aseana TaxID=3120508 RepID=UPI0039B1483E
MPASQTKADTAIVILAAGASSRFQGCKLLAEAGGKTLLEIAITNARQCVGEHVYLVTGRWHHDIIAALQAPAMPEAKWIANPDWQQGMGHSIATAIGQLQHNYQRLLLIAGDQVAISHYDLQAMIDLADDKRIVASQYQGILGIPALFPKTVFGQLLQLNGDRGAKAILKNNRDQLIVYDNPRAAIDIDTRDDLQHWLSHQQASSRPTNQ